MQRKWASLWEMGQEQGLWPKRPPEDESVPLEISEADDEARNLEAIGSDLLTEHGGVLDPQSEAFEDPDEQPEETGLRILPGSEDVVVEATEPDSEAGGGEPPRSKLKLRIQRSDIYLVVAIAFGLIVLLWALASPPVERGKTAGQRGVHLTLWERALISLGIAEAPEAPVARGNPDVRVWVDPHAALYYCPGDEQYGKTDGGRYTTQKDAQMDQFEPAFRAACE
jgi:hypothetical protein